MRERNPQSEELGLKERPNENEQRENKDKTNETGLGTSFDFLGKRRMFCSVGQD